MAAHIGARRRAFSFACVGAQHCFDVTQGQQGRARFVGSHALDA
jgi:hypothetical protein